MGGASGAAASPPPSEPFRERARERGHALLAEPPFDAVADRATLLLTSPPAGLPLEAAPPEAGLWLALDPADARPLPAPYRGALSRHGSYVEFRRPPAATPPVVLTITTNHAALLEGVMRRSLEARWTVRHCEAVHDRLDRLPRMAAAAARFPHDALERIVRPLWLQAVPALRGLWTLDPAAGAEGRHAALPVAGESAATLCRIACAYDSGDYPPPEFLIAAAGPTRIGRRIGTWLNDLAPALGGDESAARRVVAAREQVLKEVASVLAERWGDRAWLREPEAFALRTSRS